jgi:hypothetical protein
VVVESGNFQGSASQIQLDIHILNPGINSTLSLSTVKVRYYFGNTQALGNYVMRCYSAEIVKPYTSMTSICESTTNPPSTAITYAFGLTRSNTPGAMNYLEISFPANAPSIPVANGDATISVEFDNGSYTSNFTPTTDYSYLAGTTGTNVLANPHITATLSGTLAWGVVP